MWRCSALQCSQRRRERNDDVHDIRHCDCVFAVDRVKLHTEKRPWVGAGLVFGSASVGLPPLVLMSVLVGQLHYNRAFFVIMTMVGRTLRFAVVLGGVTWLRAR